MTRDKINDKILKKILEHRVIKEKKIKEQSIRDDLQRLRKTTTE